MITIDVGQDMTIADLKAVIQSDTKVPSSLQALLYNNRELLDDSKTLEQYGIRQDAMLGMEIKNAEGRAERSDRGRAEPASQVDRAEAARRDPDPEVIRLQALGNPQILAQIRGQNPTLANAVPDPNRFREVWESIERKQRDMNAEKQRELALLNADPFNVEAQAKIEEIIREERVMENVQNAMDYAPEGRSIRFPSSGSSPTPPREMTNTSPTASVWPGAHALHSGRSQQLLRQSLRRLRRPNHHHVPLVRRKMRHHAFN